LLLSAQTTWKPKEKPKGGAFVETTPAELACIAIQNGLPLVTPPKPGPRIIGIVEEATNG
jgi:hypothetical protein